jgi:hypothetical protein
MCFSAGASFTAGAVICAVGIATVKEVQKPTQWVFASIPLIFGIQQIAEGCLWMTLQNGDYAIIQKISTYIFLLTADALWPVIIPLSVLLMEEDSKRRKILRILLFTGIILALYYAYFIVFFKVTPQILNCHIYYDTFTPESLMIPAFLIYLFVTITALFVSSAKNMHLLGILMFLSCVVSVIFYTKNTTSVWCFFAAVISGVIYWIIRVPQEENSPIRLRLMKIISDNNPWKRKSN